ncbi:hypothetical protein WDU94_001652 [Cyamophila willieti]
MAFQFVLLAALCAAYVQGYPQGETAEPSKALASQINTFKSTVEKCKTDLNASPETVDLIGKKVLPTDENQRCFLECVYKNLNIIKDDKFNSEAVKGFAKERYPEGDEQLTKSQATIDKVESCMKETPVATEKCAVATTLRTCFFKNADEKKLSMGMF